MDVGRQIEVGGLKLVSAEGADDRDPTSCVDGRLARNQLKAYPPSTTSWIGSAHLCIVFMCGLPAGRLFDLG
jgi:hypothetical protein